MVRPKKTFKKTEERNEINLVETENEKKEKKIISKSLENKKEEYDKKEKNKEKKDDKKTKKTEAIVNGRDLPIGRKHAVAICNFIRGKNIDVALDLLDLVTKYKKAIPMKGEIPHRKGMMSGRYPIKGAKIYIRLLKSLKANAIANDLEIEKLKIFAMANKASRPYKRFGRGRFKRTHVTLKLIPINKQI
ncbi:MAG: uL22 family ribosomal protein [Candidatus Pacearchaeota archaeon]